MRDILRLDALFLLVVLLKIQTFYETCMFVECFWNTAICFTTKKIIPKYVAKATACSYFNWEMKM